MFSSTVMCSNACFVCASTNWLSVLSATMPVSQTIRPKVTMGEYPGLAPRTCTRLISGTIVESSTKGGAARLEAADIAFILAFSALFSSFSTASCS